MPFLSVITDKKGKPNAEGTVGNISTWITAALRNEQFFSLSELNHAIREKLELFNKKLFQKKQGSRLRLFLEDEKPLLAPLPASRFELSDWKTATVQFNYHISVDGMLYLVPYEYIKKKVDVKVTDTTIEIFYNTVIFLLPVQQAVVKLIWLVLLAWKHVNGISTQSMSAFQIYLLIWRLQD